MIDFVAMAVEEQPPPVHGPDSKDAYPDLCDLIEKTRHLLGITPDRLNQIAGMLHARRLKGIRPPPLGYGMALKTNDGRDHGVDLMQEAVDSLQYAGAAMMTEGRSEKWWDVSVMAVGLVCAAMDAFEDEEASDGERG